MTDVGACILGKADAGLVDRDFAEDVARQFADEAAEIAGDGRLPFREAQRRAAGNIQNAIERRINRKKRMFLKQGLIEADLREIAEAATNAGVPVQKAMLNRISWDPAEVAIGPSLDHRIGVVRGEAHAAMAQFLEAFRPRNVGTTRRLSRLDDVVRELFGEATGNAEAKAIAGGLTQAVRRMRGRFNQAGGDVLDRKDWGWFQTHDAARVAAVSKNEWVRFTLDRLDPARMFDLSGQPMSLRNLMRALDELYDDIATGGLSELSRAGSVFGSSVTGRANRRFLTFRDAATWLEYQREFGRGGIYDWIVGSVEAFARDTGTIEIMGPFPQATIRQMETLVAQAEGKIAVTATGAKAARAARRTAEKLPGVQQASPMQNLFNTVSGRIAIPAHGTVASISQGNRNIVVSAVLGGAWFSSFADSALMAATARINGMPVARLMQRHLKLFLPGSTADKATAVRLGFGAQGWASRAIGAQRVLGEVVGPAFTERMSDFVMRASLLSPWTEAGRWAFQTEMLGFITEQAGKGWRELPDALRTTFERYAIGPGDWDLIRHTRKWRDPKSGALFIRAEDVSRFVDPIRATGDLTQRFDAANKLQAAIMQETQFAIVEATPRVRTALTGGHPAGTFWGEVMRNTALFKSFPVSVLHLHMQRMLAIRNPVRKAEYLAWLMLGTTVMGALGEQLSQISKGRDPIDMGDPKFWLQAGMRGGGLGIFGDFLFQDQNRYGGGMLATLAGPVLGGQLPTAFKLTVGNVQQVVADDRTNAGRELSRFIRQNTPAHSLWYARLALERMIFDELDWALDPKARTRFRNIEARARRDYKQRFFSRPGRGLPQRLPDLSAALRN